MLPLEGSLALARGDGTGTSFLAAVDSVFDPCFRDLVASPVAFEGRRRFGSLFLRVAAGASLDAVDVAVSFDFGFGVGSGFGFCLGSPDGCFLVETSGLTSRLPVEEAPPAAGAEVKTGVWAGGGAASFVDDFRRA